MSNHEKEHSEMPPEIYVITCSPEFFMSIREHTPESVAEKDLHWVSTKTTIAEQLKGIKRTGRKINVVIDSEYFYANSSELMGIHELVRFLSGLQPYIRVLGIPRGGDEPGFTKVLVNEIIPYSFLDPLFAADIERLTLEYAYGFLSTNR